MATGNFIDSPAPFPIYAIEEEELQRWVCPDCETYLGRDGDGWTCPACGCHTASPEDDACWRSEWQEQNDWNEMAEELEEVSGVPLFHRVSLRSGCYTGAQVLVEVADDPREMDNEECRYAWDLCRSEAIRAYGVEQRRICRALERFASTHGFVKLSVCGRFSSGETCYTMVA